MITEQVLNKFKNGKEVMEEELLQTTEQGVIVLVDLINKYRDMVDLLIKQGYFEEYDIRVISILMKHGYSMDYFQFFNLVDDEEILLLAGEKLTQYMQKTKNDKLDVSLEEYQLIEEFKKIMESDGLSDSNVIDLACKSFYRQFGLKKLYASRDLQSLINIKTKNPNFCLKKSKLMTSYFDGVSIYIAEGRIEDSFEHEMGHALHHYTKSLGYVPLYFKNLRKFLTEEKIEKIIDCFKSYLGRKDKVCELLKNGSIKRSEVFDFINNNRKAYYIKMNETILNAINDVDCRDDIRDYLRDMLMSEEEFNNIFENIIDMMETAVILDSEKNEYSKLFDIFDALSEGEFGRNGIINNDIVIRFDFGHGKQHYDGSHIYAAFNEIVADYISLVKSPSGDKIIGILRDVMGDEFVENLCSFYERLYVEDEKKYVR